MSHILISGTLEWVNYLGLLGWAPKSLELLKTEKSPAGIKGRSRREGRRGEPEVEVREMEAWWRTPPPLLALMEEEGRHSLGVRVAFGSWEPPTPARKGIPWPHSSMELNSGTNPNEPTMKQIVPQCPQEGTQNCWHLDFSPEEQRQSSDLSNKFVLL